MAAVAKSVLTPVSRHAVGEIVIDDDLYSIGRHEPPFADLPETLVTGLAERHAKIFRQDGALYVVDLGSEGGTRVNDRPVRRRAVEIHDGDDIRFGTGLGFRLTVSGEPRADADAPAVHPVTLRPVSGRAGLEPIVVDRFPFLVGKDVGVFRGYTARYPEEGRYLSRRHALLYLKHGTVYLEDLGSTNGTFVDDRAIGRQATPVSDGATLAFGGDFFAYRAEVGAARTESDAARHEPGTIFVSSADSFLEAFCPPEEDAESAPGEGRDADGEAPPGGQRAVQVRRVGPVGRLRIFLSQLREALTDRAAGSRRHRWRALALVAAAILALAVPFGYYVAGGPERDIRQLMAGGRYGEAAGIADAYLESHPEAESIRLLATESLVRQVAQPWSEAISGGKFESAARVLGAARAHSAHNDDGRLALSLLDWMTRLERFVAGSGGIESPVVIFRDEKPITRLVDWWSDDARGHRNLLNRLLAYGPELEQPATRAMSHLVALEKKKSVYLGAIARLDGTIRERLAAGRAETLPDVLEAFERKYAAVGGTDRLWSDLRGWTALRKAVRARDLDTTLKLAANTKFSTPPFQAAAAGLDAELPPPEITAGYRKASGAWASGAWNVALDTLQGLTDQPWGEVATRRLERYRAVLDDYRALMQAKGSDEYGRRMLAFYARLDPVEDARLRRALEPDYRQYRQQALERAVRAREQASAEWTDYRKDGGIDGLLRLENPVSESYRRQTQRLSRAFAATQAAVGTYRLLGEDAPEPLRRLAAAVRAEVARQRGWLEDMHIVLDASLLKAKLALLPTPPEEKP